jgi:hypothetical protein
MGVFRGAWRPRRECWPNPDSRAILRPDMSDVPPSPDAHRTTEHSLGAPAGADAGELPGSPTSTPCPPSYPARPWYETDDAGHAPVLEVAPDAADEPGPGPGARYPAETDAAGDHQPIATNTSIFEPRLGPRPEPDEHRPQLNWPADERDPADAAPIVEPVIRLEGAPAGLAWAETTTLAGFDHAPDAATRLPWSTGEGPGRLLLDDAGGDEGFVAVQEHRSGWSGLRTTARDRAQVLYRRQGVLAAVGLVVLAIIGALSFPRTWRDPGPGLAVDTANRRLEADAADDHPLLQQQVDGDVEGRRASIEPHPGPTGGARPAPTEPTVEETSTTATSDGPDGIACILEPTDPGCDLSPRAPTTRPLDSTTASTSRQLLTTTTTTTEPEPESTTTTTTTSETTTTARRTTTTARKTTTTARRTTTTARRTTTTARRTTTTARKTTTTTTRPTTTTTTTGSTTTGSTTTTGESTTTTGSTTTTSASTTATSSTAGGLPPGSAVQCEVDVPCVP